MISVISKMTNLKTKTTAVTLPEYTKQWPGINISFLAFDFDSTCTVQDTTSLYYKATKKYRNANDKEAKQLDQQWESIGEEYLTGYKETIDRLLQDLPSHENGQLNQEGLNDFLLEMHKFDTQSTKRVESSKLLAGISKEGIEDIAKQVDLQPGCLDVLGEFNLTQHVITFNWSKDLVQTVLGKLNHLTITGNNFPAINNISTGKVDKQVSSSFDKERHFLNLLKSGPKSKQSGLSVFIGDSIGDLLALLKANIGIVIGQSGTMRRVCKVFGIILVPLSDLYGCHDWTSVCETRTLNIKDNNVLYETNSWQEIGELLLGNMQDK